jgi:hypothetical protein
MRLRTLAVTHDSNTCTMLDVWACKVSKYIYIHTYIYIYIYRSVSSDVTGVNHRTMKLDDDGVTWIIILSNRNAPRDRQPLQVVG